MQFSLALYVKKTRKTLFDVFLFFYNLFECFSKCVYKISQSISKKYELFVESYHKLNKVTLFFGIQLLALNSNETVIYDCPGRDWMVNL